MRSAVVTVVLLATLAASPARADRDFALGSDDWNGASRFLAIAREEAGTVEISPTLDLDRVRETDAIVLLGPDRPLPEDDLVEFVRRGGRLVIADDFGTAGGLLTRFGMQRTEPGATDAPRVRGNDALLVARPFYTHPLTEGVGVVVTNRPALLTHPRLVPLIGLDENGPGLVLTGVVGEGRVVAVGDPSSFANVMMGLSGNARFARNLVRFAAGGEPRRRLFVATSDTRYVGSFEGVASGSRRERIEDTLRAIGQTRMPDAAIRIACVVLALLTLLLLASMRDRRLEAELPWLEPGRGASTRADEAALVLHDALELAMARRLGLRVGASVAERRTALRALAMSRAEERRMLRALDRTVDGARSRAELEQAVRVLDAALMRRSGQGKNAR